MKTRILFALLLTLIAGSALAVPVRGKVVTIDGASPYPDVEVTVVATSQSLYTDSEGEFFIRNLEPGVYEVKVKTSRSETTHRITVREQPATEVKLAVK